MGSLLVCNVEESIIDNSTTYNVRTLLGTGTAGGTTNPDQEIALREVYVRRIAERMVIHARKVAGVGANTILGGAEDGSGPIPPLVVGLGLRPKEKRSVDDFNKIVDTALKLYEEGWVDLTRDGRVEEEATSETFREQSIHNNTHELLTNLQYPELKAAISCPFNARGFGAQLPAFRKYTRFNTGHTSTSVGARTSDTVSQ
eukprot:scaffold559_cov190-Alexandrium_tamarense.AAC.13